VPQMRREPLPTRTATAIRLAFVTLALTSVVLGYLGLNHYVRAEEAARILPSGDDSPASLLYYDLELFLVQSTPLSIGGPPPWPLQIARFSAPCVALYALAELAIALFATRIRHRRLRRMRGHAIVCGATRAAESLAERLRASGMQVVVVALGVSGVDRADRSRLSADPRAAWSLLTAGAARAARIYACLDLDEENAEVASVAERLRLESGYPEKIHVLIKDLDLCSSLRARRWSLAESVGQHLDFFNPDELAAQATVRADEAAFAARAQPAEIAVVGTGAYARSVLVEFARQWVARSGTGAPVRVLLIGKDAVACACELYGRYSFLADACQIEPRTEPLEEVLARRRGDPEMPPLNRLHLCQDDESEAFKSALGALGLFQAARAEVVVRLDRMAGLAEGFRPTRDGGLLFDALGGRLRLVDATMVGCTPELIEDGLVEQLARASHQHYLTTQIRAGALPGSSAALVRWEELNEEYKSSNRDQVVEIGRKLAGVGCLLSPRHVGDPPFSFRADELEFFAELEHERWLTERNRRGWTWAPEHDEAEMLHPDLVTWGELTEEARRKDRQAIQAWPQILAEAGLAVIRGRPPAAPDGSDPACAASPDAEPGGTAHRREQKEGAS
jgi:voltage-gated potassium channel Kch